MPGLPTLRCPGGSSPSEQNALSQPRVTASTRAVGTRCSDGRGGEQARRADADREPIAVDERRGGRVPVRRTERPGHGVDAGATDVLGVPGRRRTDRGREPTGPAGPVGHRRVDTDRAEHGQADRRSDLACCVHRAGRGAGHPGRHVPHRDMRGRRGQGSEAGAEQDEADRGQDERRGGACPAQCEHAERGDETAGRGDRGGRGTAGRTGRRAGPAAGTGRSSAATTARFAAPTSRPRPGTGA